MSDLSTTVPAYPVASDLSPRWPVDFSPVYAGLVRRGAIRCVGFCERKKGHSTSGGRVWGLA